MYRNIITQESSETKPASIRGTVNPTWDQCVAAGWRIQVDPPAPADGYERLTPLVWVQDPENAEQAIAQYTDTLIQDRLDAEAAARAEYLEGYDVHDRPLRVPSLELQDGEHTWGIVVDGDTPAIVPIERESERLTNAEFEAAKAAAKQANVERRARIDQYKTDMGQVETALAAAKASLESGGDAYAAIVALPAGAARNALIAVAGVVRDVGIATNNLKQAVQGIAQELR